jgi:DNA-binding beta-propeller fold protein YncE
MARRERGWKDLARTRPRIRGMNRRELLLAAAAAPAALALPGSALAAVRGGVTVALVTADDEDRVLAVDLGGLRVVERLAVPDHPAGIETVDRMRSALVLSQASGTVTILDAVRLRVRTVLSGFQAPRYAAGDPNGRYAYVSDDAAGQVIAIDVPAARVVGRVEVGAGARHITIDAGGSRVVTSLGSKAPRIAVVDVGNPRRPRLERTFPADDLAHDVGFTPDGTLLWVSSGVDRRLAIHDATTFRRVHAVVGDGAPQHVTFDDLGRFAYVASGESGTLRTHRMGDGAVLRTRTVTTGSYNVCALGGSVVTPSLDDGRLTVLDAKGLRSVHLTTHAHDACIVVA